MVAQRVAHGSIAESIQSRAIIGPHRESLMTIRICNGAMPGQPIDVSSIIEPRLTHRGVPGRSVRSISGGTKHRKNGQVMIYQIFRSTNRQITRHHPMPAEWMLSQVAILSS